MVDAKDIRTIRRRLLVLLLVFPFLYLALMAGAVFQDYRETLKSAESDARSFSAALNEHANRSIGEADRLLLHAIAEFRRGKAEALLSDEAALHRLLQAYTGKLPQFTAINVLDAQGRLRGSGMTYPFGAASFADREYFRHHLAVAGDDLYIGRPLVSRTSSKLVMTLSRSVRSRDGKLQAVFVAGLPLAYFDSFYRSLNVKNSRLLLVRTDGWQLLESPLGANFESRNMSQRELFQKLAEAPSGSYRIERGYVDDTPRIIGYANSAQYPLLSVVSLSHDEVLRKWRGHSRDLAVVAVVSIAIMLALVAMLWRRLRDLREARTNIERQSHSLARSERRYQQLVDGIDGIVWEAEAPAMRFTYVSASAARITGYPAAEWLADGDFWTQRLGGAPGDGVLAQIAEQDSAILEHHLLSPNGRQIWLRSNVTLATEREDKWLLRGVMVDYTERKLAFEELEQAAQVFETSLHAIMIFSTTGEILRVNRAFLTLTGFTEQEMVGMSAERLEAMCLEPGYVARIRDALRDSGKWLNESTMRVKDGREISIMHSCSVIRNADGRAISTVAIFHDITGQKTSEQQLYQLAHFDLLTQLPNRQSVAGRIDESVARARAQHSALAVCLIDIDHFKTINDSLGHDAGDRMLRAVAQRLTAFLGPQATAARIGGDEFVVLLEARGKEDYRFDQAAEHLARAVTGAIDIGGKELFVSISMGIAVYPQDGATSEVLLRNADTAMYRAKAAGRNCWRFFDASMARHAERRLELETALRRAIERNELVLHYQPQRALGSGRIVGVEALLRWMRPGIGMVPPLDFIPLAEESGLILPIGDWVLRTACAQAAEWLRERGQRLRVAVNIAARQIHDPGFVAQVRAALQQTGLPADLLELEITESSIVENLDESVSKLHELKSLGVTVAIDDFGTGYSSLSYLKRLPIDRLKIDRSFVKDTPEDADDCAIVRTIIAMSDSLGMEVIAEGVESARQVEFLAAEGCDEIQGYFVCRPLPASEVEAKLDSYSPPESVARTSTSP